MMPLTEQDREGEREKGSCSKGKSIALGGVAAWKGDF